MRIGINATFSRKPDSGIGQVTMNFLRRLVEEEKRKTKNKNRHEFILYLEQALPAGFDLPDNFRQEVFLPFYRRDDLIRKIWWEKYLLPQKARRDKCDLFFSLYQCPTILSKDIWHLMLVHDIIPTLFPGYLDNSRKRQYQRLTERGIARADHILAVSRRTEKDLIQYLDIPADRISVSYIASDEIYRRPATRERSRKVLKRYRLNPGYIFAGGGMEIRKNIDGVLRAYQLLKEKHKAGSVLAALPKLVIYGKLLPGLSLAIDAQKLVRELDLTKDVRFLGAVPQADLPALFANAAVFVYPSHYEGFGLPVLEAMSQGTPVIAGKNSSLPEVGLDSILYCRDDDSEEIARVMGKVLSDQKLRTVLAQRGRERSQAFSWDRFVTKFYNLLKQS